MPKLLGAKSVIRCETRLEYFQCIVAHPAKLLWGPFSPRIPLAPRDFSVICGVDRMCCFLVVCTKCLRVCVLCILYTTGNAVLLILPICSSSLGFYELPHSRCNFFEQCTLDSVM